MKRTEKKRKKRVKKEASNRKLTANEETDVKDIRNNMLFTKSGYIVGFLRLYPINIDLLSESEKVSLCTTLTATFKPEKQPFVMYVIPRTVDMELYLNNLSDLYDQEISDVNRKKILRGMIREASDKVMNGNNFEHQYYIKVWETYNVNDTNLEHKINERLKNFEVRYQTVGIQTKRLEDTEIIRLCNLFNNSNTAVFENYETGIYHPISIIGRN